MRTKSVVRCAVFGLVAAAAASAVADEVIGLDGTSGYLWRWDQWKSPQTYAVQIKGLEPDERILAIDSNTKDFSRLYGVSDRRLYELSSIDGQATPVGPRFSREISAFPTPNFDFDPVTGFGLLGLPYVGRLVGVDATTGRLLGDPAEVPAGSLAYVAGDPAFGLPVYVKQFACSDESAGANAMTIFGVDFERKTLVRVGSLGGLVSGAGDPDAVTTVGPLTGLDGDPAAAFEIGRDGKGYALSTHVGNDRALYSVDLSSGAATSLHAFGPTIITDIAVLPYVTPLPTLPLDVKKAALKYDFRRSHEGDGSITLTGAVPYPTNGGGMKRVAVDVDGVVREFTTDSKGRGVSGKDVFRFVGKLTGGRLRYELILKKIDLRGVADVQTDTPTQPTALAVDLFLEGRAYRTRLELDYFRGRGGRGTAKTP